jgi:outer membrane protein assembly factor BamA
MRPGRSPRAGARSAPRARCTPACAPPAPCAPTGFRRAGFAGSGRAGLAGVVAGLAALLALAAPQAAAAQRDEPVEVRSVTFSGADRISGELLRTAIATQPTRCVSVALQPLCWMGMSQDRHHLDTRALAADVFRLRVFYYQRGFREVRVELDTIRNGGGMDITFRIEEGAPVIVRAVRVEGAEGLDHAVLRSLPVRPGRPFSVIEFEATRDTLIGRLANRGYAAADALASYEIPGGDPYHADVEYHLIPGRPGRFGAIEITGVERVSPSVVQRMLTFREGDMYSRQALLRSQRNLFALEVFRHAEIMTPLVSQEDSIVPVRVQVNEGDLHRVRIGMGMSTSDYLNAEGRWVSRNFLGGGRRLELRGRINNMVADPLSGVTPFESCTSIYCDIAGSLTADFVQPWFFGPRNTVGAGAFVERFSLAGVYVRTSRGAYGSLGRSVLRTGVITAAYRPELTRLESDGDLIFCANFVACEERDIDVLRDPHRLAPVALSFSLDRSNSLFAPTRGYILRMDTELAARATGSEFSYARLLGEVSGYHDPFRGFIVATRIRPGWARSLGEPANGLGLHPQKRFFAGGPNSVRGFAQYRLGPKLLTVDAANTLALPAGVPGSPGAGCTAQQINGGGCDVSRLVEEAPGALNVQPVGGNVSIEGNIEVRYPIWADRVRGATFLDFGQVWRSVEEATVRSLRFTPGLGVRYFSPIGPIRVDVGYNPSGAEWLTVMTTEVCERVATECIDIDPDRTYMPDQLGNRRKLRSLPAVRWQPYDSFMDRLQFHFSIGQAF